MLTFLLATNLQATLILNVIGTIESTDPLQTGRLLRNGIASQWGANKPNPGLNDASIQRHYDEHVVNVLSFASPIFYEIELDSPNTSLFHLGYVGGFNPAAPSSNYYGDPGSSAATSICRVSLASGATPLTLVVHEVNRNGGVGTNYNLIVRAFSDDQRTDLPSSVPEPATAALTGTALCALAVAGRWWKRR
ncbi:hypothetical protein [uncultured Paludibaculum sp.]|uniref:hypothetical protein n=1 Tax=uncultured Paludibaculum sp. TaxID=1765020 RepID=UPI00374DAEFA